MGYRRYSKRMHKSNLDCGFGFKKTHKACVFHFMAKLIDPSLIFDLVLIISIK